jgi:hypothetical protein
VVRIQVLGSDACVSGYVCSDSNDSEILFHGQLFEMDRFVLVGKFAGYICSRLFNSTHIFIILGIQIDFA